MHTSRFTEDPMVEILREADEAPVADVAKKHGISEQTQNRGQGALSRSFAFEPRKARSDPCF